MASGPDNQSPAPMGVQCASRHAEVSSLFLAAVEMLGNLEA
jgi:hypothetical protein